MAKGISNTSRTLKWLRDQGWSADVVERWMKNPKHPAGGYRKDLFNIIDIIALSNRGIMGVQSCGQAFAEHNRKVLAEPLALKWLEAGGDLILIGWRKILKKRGGKQKIWAPRIKHYLFEDFNKPS